MQPEAEDIEDLATFRRRVRSGRGIVVIDDTRRRTAVAHSLRCEHVRESRFVEKVIHNANGRYVWAADLESARQAVQRSVAQCRVCGAAIYPLVPPRGAPGLTVACSRSRWKLPGCSEYLVVDRRSVTAI